MKDILDVQYIVPRVPKFRSFRSTVSRFQDMTHFRTFPLTPMLKYQSATKVLIFGRSTKGLYRYIPL